MVHKNRSNFKGLKKIYIAGAVLVCGLLLVSVDDCENMNEKLENKNF